MPVNQEATGSFEDIASLTDREIQYIVREFDADDLGAALVGAKKEVRERIFRNVSERVGAMIERYIERYSSWTNAGEGARSRVLGALEDLGKCGMIIWPPPAGEGGTTLGSSIDDREAPEDPERQALRSLMKRPFADLDLGEINRILVGLSEICKSEGFMAVEEMVKGAGDEFHVEAVRLAVDTSDSEIVRAVLSNLMESLLHEQQVRYRRILEGIVAISDEYPPRIVAQKLRVTY